MGDGSARSPADAQSIGPGPVRAQTFPGAGRTDAPGDDEPPRPLDRTPGGAIAYPRGASMKVIAAVAEKGGVGRTALSCILAAGLSQAGARVLMVVLDVHAAGAAVFLAPPADATGAAQLLLGSEVDAQVGHLRRAPARGRAGAR